MLTRISQFQLGFQIVFACAGASGSKSFEATRLANGMPYCAVEEPSLKIPTDQFPEAMTEGLRCIAPIAQCGMRCAQNDECTNYNYKEDLKICELFYYTPMNCSFVPDCSHFQIAKIQSCCSAPLPTCKDNSTLTNVSISGSLRSVFHDQYVQLTCNVTFTGGMGLLPTIRWTDNYGVVVKNATTVTYVDQLMSSIVIPAFFPSIQPFTCIVTDAYDPTLTYNCTTMNITVVCHADFQYSAEADRCYKVLKERVSWTNAVGKCPQLYEKAYLATINSTAEQNATESLLRSENQTRSAIMCQWSNYWRLDALFWISGQRKNMNCNLPFVWKPRSGVEIEFTYVNWASRQPDCYNGIEKCVHLKTSELYKWDDFGCDVANCAVCEYAPN